MLTLQALGGWPVLLNELIAGNHLTADQTGAAMSTILAGDATPAQVAGFVVALRAKGETAEELAGMLGAAMDAASIVPLTEIERADCVDVVGTGGDGSHSINVSTMAAIVTAAAGAPVCKHGNRSASSKAGTADVFELLGVHLELSPEGVARCVREAGIGFCFAPAFHPAFRFAGPPRREMGVSTAFNLLGPMANPGRVKRQLIGVANPTFARPMVDALAQQGLDVALGGARGRARRVDHHRALDCVGAFVMATFLSSGSIRPISVLHQQPLTTSGAARLKPTLKSSGESSPETQGHTATS